MVRTHKCVVQTAESFSCPFEGAIRRLCVAEKRKEQRKALLRTLKRLMKRRWLNTGVTATLALISEHQNPIRAFNFGP